MVLLHGFYIYPQSWGKDYLEKCVPQFPAPLTSPLEMWRNPHKSLELSSVIFTRNLANPKGLPVRNRLQLEEARGSIRLHQVHFLVQISNTRPRVGGKPSGWEALTQWSLLLVWVYHWVFWGRKEEMFLEFLVRVVLIATSLTSQGFYENEDATNMTKLYEEIKTSKYDSSGNRNLPDYPRWSILQLIVFLLCLSS